MFLKFDTINNIRDLGGIKTQDGKVIKYNKILRSGDLHRLSKEELETLKEKHNLKTVIDFRSTKSFVNKRDLIDESITYRHIHVLDELERVSYSRNLEHPYQFMLHIYESFATCKESIYAYKRFFKWLLKAEDGATLFHCTSGKDRTGVAAALIMYILGCDMDTIYREYLRTNNFASKQYNQAVDGKTNLTPHELEYYECFYYVKKEYLDTYFRKIHELYGSLDSFIAKNLGLSDDDINTLKERLLTIE